MKILILCTGNSCRSQMVEGFLQSFNSNLIVHSAGTKPSNQVHSKAVFVMDEIGVSISENKPKNVAQFTNESFDFVISVCDGAKESCPIFIGDVKNHIHIGFDDPDAVTGTDQEILKEFYRIRNEILIDFFQFYQTTIKKLL